MSGRHPPKKGPLMIGDDLHVFRTEDWPDPVPPTPDPPPEPRSTPHGLPTRGTSGTPQKYLGNRPGCALTDELFDAIVAHVKAGNFRTVAARAEGVSLRTFHSWVERGREQIADYIDGRREDLPIQAQLIMEIERVEGLCFVEQNKLVLDEDGNVKDRMLRFGWMRARFAREFSPPTETVNDEAATVSKVDVYELLVARLKAIKDAYP